MIFIRPAREVRKGGRGAGGAGWSTVAGQGASVEFTNKTLDGRTVGLCPHLINRQFVISRILRPDGTIRMADADSVIHLGDRLGDLAGRGHRGDRGLSPPRDDRRAVQQYAQRRAGVAPHPDHEIVAQRQFSDLRLRTKYGITITARKLRGAPQDLIPLSGLNCRSATA